MHTTEKLPLPPVRMNVVRRPDGTVLLSSRDPLADFDPNILRCFQRLVAAQPEKTLYAQRSRDPGGEPGDWERLSFAGAQMAIESIGQWLLDSGFACGDTLLIISGNSVAHAMMRLGAMAAGVTCCPISVNYALMGGSYARLRHVLELLDPKIIFAETGGPFDAALQACDLAGRVVVSRRPDLLGVAAVSYQQLLATPGRNEIRARIGRADPDAHAVYMLTSGSTGVPKAVIHTQRMLATNLHQAFQVLGAVSGWDDVMLDWLPWSHVSGAFNMLAAAVFGGTLYIDEGKPVPGLFDETLRNLREIAVPYFCNMPAGFTILVEALESDAALRKQFFSRLRMLLYGGAGLPQPVLDRLQQLAVRETGRRVFITAGYGLTETASGCMAIFFESDKAGIGLPMPGLEVKLIPIGGRYEVRMRGDNVTPGYLRDPQGSAAAFDDEGFFRTGDSANFHDEGDIGKGMYFTGRLTEEFKLGTGSWVLAGRVRASLLEYLAPAVSDLLLCGAGRDYLAVLGVPNPAGLRRLADSGGADVSGLTGQPKTMAFLRQALQAYNAANPASSTRVGRFSFLKEPPDPARNEVSDKGALNQLIAAQTRAAEIEELYAPAAGRRVLVL